MRLLVAALKRTALLFFAVVYGAQALGQENKPSRVIFTAWVVGWVSSYCHYRGSGLVQGRICGAPHIRPVVAQRPASTG